MPKVSIIIPVYNGVNFIRECIESLLQQTLQDIEILPVDAGSTDGTVEILKEYAIKDDRVKVVHSDKKSMGYQYNMGMEVATGEYIGFTEADDYVAETMFECLYKTAQTYNVDYVKSDFDMFIDKGEERLFLNYQILEPKLRRLYGTVIDPKTYPEIMYRDVNMWNGIYKTEFIRKNQICLNETPKAAFQDTGFVLQSFLCAEQIMYIHHL